MWSAPGACVMPPLEMRARSILSESTQASSSGAAPITATRSGFAAPRNERIATSYAVAVELRQGFYGADVGVTRARVLERDEAVGRCAVMGASNRVVRAERGGGLECL